MHFVHRRNINIVCGWVICCKWHALVTVVVGGRYRHQHYCCWPNSNATKHFPHRKCDCESFGFYCFCCCCRPCILRQRHACIRIHTHTHAKASTNTDAFVWWTRNGNLKRPNAEHYAPTTTATLTTSATGVSNTIMHTKQFTFVCVCLCNISSAYNNKQQHDEAFFCCYLDNVTVTAVAAFSHLGFRSLRCICSPRHSALVRSPWRGCINEIYISNCRYTHIIGDSYIIYIRMCMCLCMSSHCNATPLLWMSGKCFVVSFRAQLPSEWCSGVQENARPCIFYDTKWK